MKIKTNDLLVISLLSLLVVPAVLLTSSDILRGLLGIPFLVICPGYALTMALFPRKTTSGFLEKTAYSLALSFTVVSFTGLLFNYIWEITLYPMLWATEALTFLFLGIAWYRRRTIKEPSSGTLTINLSEAWNRYKPLDRALVILLGVVIIGAVVASFVVYGNNQESYSELYLLDSEGRAGVFQTELAVGEAGTVMVTIVNEEQETVEYTLVITVPDSGETRVNGIETDTVGVELEDGTSWEGTVNFSFDNPGNGQRIAFDLYVPESDEPYLQTHLSVDVTE